MNKITAMSRMLASRCFRNNAAAVLRGLGPRAAGPFAPPRVSGLRSAVSLTSLIPILRSHPVDVYWVIPTVRGGPPGFQPGGPPRARYAAQRDATAGQTEIAPVCLMYFWSFVEPSNRLGVAVYGSTLPLVTNFRPVSVVGGETRPPESWNR